MKQKILGIELKDPWLSTINSQTINFALKNKNIQYSCGNTDEGFLSEFSKATAIEYPLEKSLNLNNRKSIEITDKTESEESQQSANLNTDTRILYRGYTKDYVKGLEAELNRLISENIYLKSDEYTKKIAPKDNIQELEDKINNLVKENENLRKENENLCKKNEDLHKKNDEKEKESMSKKINFLSLLIRRLSCESIDRENILTTLKDILESD